VLLGDKLKHLRLVEGQLRNLGRPLTQAEVVRLMREEVGGAVSQSYLSQLESGDRVHLSAHSRDLLARFFKVHPGYLVSDPPGYEEGLTAAAAAPRARDLREWLERHAAELEDDPVLYHLLLRLARQPDPRRWLMLLDDLLDLPPERQRTLDPGAWAGGAVQG
jgi:transcriptional regulator with XRE-family HTH domain